MSTSSKDERLDLRVSADVKRIIERAAALSGQTVSTSILGTMTRRARKVIRESQVIELSDRDRDRLLAALDDAEAGPNDALRRAAERIMASGTF